MLGPDRRRRRRVAYRLLCDAGYYGARCALSCTARHDKFGHYVCSDDGSRVCLDGWTGAFCDVRAYQRFIRHSLSVSLYETPAHGGGNCGEVLSNPVP